VTTLDEVLKNLITLHKQGIDVALGPQIGPLKSVSVMGTSTGIDDARVHTGSLIAVFGIVAVNVRGDQMGIDQGRATWKRASSRFPFFVPLF
jgi:hypothetical protein